MKISHLGGGDGTPAYLFSKDTDGGAVFAGGCRLLEMNPVILCGAISGNLTTTDALYAASDAAESSARSGIHRQLCRFQRAADLSRAGDRVYGLSLRFKICAFTRKGGRSRREDPAIRRRFYYSLRRRV
jgi:hypothetical protein